MREASKLALSGRPIYNGISETSLTTNFELLNLVPSDHPYHSKINDNQAFPSKTTTTTTTTTTSTQNQHHKEKRSTSNANATNVVSSSSTTKWRRVGLVSATSVRLDTIVWPGGDIVVSGTHKISVNVIPNGLSIMGLCGLANRTRPKMSAYRNEFMQFTT